MAANLAAIERARQRRSEQAAASLVRIQWFVREVSDKIALTARERVRVATEYLKSKVVQNISAPVVKSKGRRGRIVVSGRSKAGEFPRADTTQLIKGIFSTLGEPVRGMFEGYVGTPHDYGLILETSAELNRSFLVRTLREEEAVLRRILTGPIK